jgi:hypothetical protein
MTRMAKAQAAHNAARAAAKRKPAKAVVLACSHCGDVMTARGWLSRVCVACGDGTYTEKEVTT